MGFMPRHAAIAEVLDPLLASATLPHSAVFYPFGFQAKVTSNSAQVLRAAEESWGAFPSRFTTQPLDIRCVVSESAEGERPPFPVFRAQRNILTAVADSENFFSCDLLTGYGSAWVTRSAVADTNYLRRSFLEAMAYSLLDALHLVAVHAACVSLGEHGVLLAGDSGCGKSSLAYGCARRGWTYTSDDASYLVRRQPGRIVMGNPLLFRFRATAGELFPRFRLSGQLMRAGSSTLCFSTGEMREAGMLS
jgi:hypothetical protein